MPGVNWLFILGGLAMGGLLVGCAWYNARVVRMTRRCARRREVRRLFVFPPVGSAMNFLRPAFPDRKLPLLLALGLSKTESLELVRLDRRFHRFRQSCLALFMASSAVWIVGMMTGWW